MKKRLLFGTLLLSAILAAPVYATNTNSKNTMEETTAVAEEDLYDPTEEIIFMWAPDGHVYGVPKSAVEVAKEGGYYEYETESTTEEEHNVMSYDDLKIYNTASEEMYQDIRDQLDSSGKHRAYIEVWDDATNLIIPSDILQKLNELNGTLGVIFDEKTYDEEDYDEDPIPEQKYTILIVGDSSITVNENIDITSSFDKTDAGYVFTCNANTTLNGMYMSAIYTKAIDDIETGIYTIVDNDGNTIGKGTCEGSSGLWIEFSTMKSGTAVKTAELPETEEYTEEIEAETQEEAASESEPATKDSKTTEEITTDVETNSSYTWAYVTAICICGALGGVGYYMMKKKKKI